MKRRMSAELGANWESRFKEFNREAAAAASLARYIELLIWPIMTLRVSFSIRICLPP